MRTPRPSRVYVGCTGLVAQGCPTDEGVNTIKRIKGSPPPSNRQKYVEIIGTETGEALIAGCTPILKSLIGVIDIALFHQYCFSHPKSPFKIPIRRDT